jgi:hypothetical protein
MLSHFSRKLPLLFFIVYFKSINKKLANIITDRSYKNPSSFLIPKSIIPNMNSTTKPATQNKIIAAAAVGGILGMII